MHNIFSFFGLLFVLLISPGCTNSDTDPAVIWRFQQNGYEIYEPQLSFDNTQIVFSRMRHVPDGIAASNFTESELEQLDKKIAENNRFADPEVVLVDLTSKKIQQIDYGWTPSFSKNNTKILYSHQLQPVSGRRLISETQAGNEIREYDIRNQKINTVAQPRFGYLSSPKYTQTGAIVCALSDAVNGAWGGNVGVGIVDPASHQLRELYPPTKDHDLYHLVSQFAVLPDATFVLRQRPLTPGLYLADSYAHELVNSTTNTVIYNWNTTDSEDLNAPAMRICPSGLEVFNKQWLSLHPTITASHLQTPYGISSPDCKHSAVLSDKSLTIYTLDNTHFKKWKLKKGRILSATWSADSAYIILVVTNGESVVERFLYDEIIILDVNSIFSIKSIENIN